MTSRSIPVFLLVATLLAAPLAARAAGGGKTHLGVRPNQIVNLSTFTMPPDNSGGALFYYDRDFHFPFSVPKGFSFVVTDVFVEPNAGDLTGAEETLVVVSFGARIFSAHYIGAETRHYALAGGFVIPSGASVTGRNTTYSTTDCDVHILGYFVKGAGLGSGESPFPAPAP